MIKVIETDKGFRLVATTRKDQKALSVVFQSVPSNATFRKENWRGDMAHFEFVEFGYAYKPPIQYVDPLYEQD